MALAPINVQLTPFQQIEILRHEITDREEELKAAEKNIREILYQLEKIKYLKSLHPFFLNLEEPVDNSQLHQLHAKRESLHQAINTMKATLSALETQTGGTPTSTSASAPPLPPGAARVGIAPPPPLPPAPAGAPKKPRIQSFEDFQSGR